MASITYSVKQRKLSDLRVVDLQRELRSFNIPYDKKELKGSLVEKLRQALCNRNLDPDNYLFDTSAELKSISSDETNRSHDENDSHSIQLTETSTMEIENDQRLNIENPVQTNSTTTSTTLMNETDDEQNDETNRMNTIDLRQIVEDHDNENPFLTIDQSTIKNEDENNNDRVDPSLIQISCSPFDEELDKNTQISSPTNSQILNSNTQQQTSGEDEQRTTTDLSTDYDSVSKSETNREESTDEQQKKENTNKDQSYLWVSNIAKETHASDLKTLFSKYGKVLTTKVISSSSSQWFGYITLATPNDVEKCINVLHQTELHGKKIYVDREMHDEIRRSPSSKSNSNSRSTSDAHRKRIDHSNHRSSPKDSIDDGQDRLSSKKRSGSTSNENKKKLSTNENNKSNNDEKSIKSNQTDTSIKRSNNEKRRTSSSSSNSQSSKYQNTRTDNSKSTDKSESSNKSSSNDRRNEKQSHRSEKSSIDSSKSKASSPVRHRSHSNERRPNSSSTKSDYHRSSSIDKSLQRQSSHNTSNTYEKSKETFSKDTHRPTSSRTLENDRRSSYQNEQRLRQEKELLVRKQYVQQKEEEKIKEQQRRLAEERERVRREFEILERERLEIERTRLALEKEKQDQARELEKQQRRLVDEAKQRQVDVKLRDDKLHRLSHNENNKRPRSSQRSHHSNINNNTNSTKKGYDHRSSTNINSGRGRGRDRSLGDTNRDYYPEPKRQYTNNENNQRETLYRDRSGYRESDHPTSSSSLNLNSTSSITSSSNNQRYIQSSSNQHRLSDPYNTLPQRGRDMALPPTSTVSSNYERSSRNPASSPTNSTAILRRPHSRERFDDRNYMQQTQRRDRSPPTANTLRREPMESSHWERPKLRDTTHYPDDTPKYLSNQYMSESSQSTQQQQQQQQGLWSAAPPSRQQHHHSDLPVKTTSHVPVVDPYSWQHVSQQVSSQSLPSHHPQNLSSTHDRSRTNVNANPRIPILSSNQAPPPPPPPPSSSRGTTSGQTHLYSHPGVPVSALSTSQQHTALAPPPPPLHHTAAYVTQQAPPTGLVLHSTGQTRPYEQHYVVTQPLQPRRF